MSQADHKMGGDNVTTNTLAILFSDGTLQTTAGIQATGGSSIVADGTGINMNDPYGGGLNTSSTFASFGAGGSGGGFSQFFDGTEWNTVVSDGNGNGLGLGQGFGSNYNLSNTDTSSGIVNPSGSITDIYGTPVNIIGTLVFGGVTMPDSAPTTGQVLTATSPTTAAWQTPTGGAVQKTARVAMGTIASATPSTPVTSYTWPTPFADNNYTIVGTVVVAETPSDGAATAICCIGMIQLQPDGTGFNFVVCNADGVSHDVTAQFIAIHD
jgi:hypothetical protein